jgi:hypothetical protein
LAKLTFDADQFQVLPKGTGTGTGTVSRQSCESQASAYCMTAKKL